MDSVKTIFGAMMDILTRRQQYELLDDSASFSEVRIKREYPRKILNGLLRKRC